VRRDLLSPGANFVRHGFQVQGVPPGSEVLSVSRFRGNPWRHPARGGAVEAGRPPHLGCKHWQQLATPRA